MIECIQTASIKSKTNKKDLVHDQACKNNRILSTYRFASHSRQDACWHRLQTGCGQYGDGNGDTGDHDGDGDGDGDDDGNDGHDGDGIDCHGIDRGIDIGNSDGDD
ncbi:hypothetical protein HanRHA438_Chr06g0252551 [Helianthus annuus]|nr:hypothetical protein HanRHA438_Chr06g0252551 [Helianthus annuus]